ncbi:MAG TPA: hypothetical protein P5297_04375 [Bacilli bacterium]|nr:hypothetical protein [Bacilli bacterium]
MKKRKWIIKLKKVVSSQIFTVVISLIIILVIVQLNIVKSDLSELIKLNIVLSVGIVSVVSWLIQLIEQFIEKRTEEKLKLNDNTEELKKIYVKEKLHEIGGQETPLVVCIPQTAKISLTLSSELFALDPRIIANMNSIMNSHRNSKFDNKPILRVNDLIYDPNSSSYQLIVSPSDQYNTLLTNKAMDASIVKHVTVRDLFEYGPRLSSFKQSKLANGVGLCVLAQTSDGYFLLLRRTDKNPTGKNIAGSCFSILYDKYTDSHRSDYQNNPDFYEYVLKQSIYRGIANKLCVFNEDQYDEKAIDLKNVKLLGMVRNLIEGGKPELVYYYRLSQKLDEVKAAFKNNKKKKSGVKKLIYFTKEEVKYVKPNKICLNKKRYELSVVTSYAIDEAIKSITNLAELNKTKKGANDDDQI